MMVQNSSRLALQIAAWLCVGCFLFGAVGCSQSGAQKAGGSQQTKLPKLKFHRPKSLLAVAKRLDEICTALQSEGPIPEPIQFTVIELVHGEGSGAHSHYYLDKSAGSSDPNVEAGDEPDYDDHGGMKSVELTHQLEIDVFTELSDVILWIPNIAAAEGLEESEWTVINKKVRALEGSMVAELKRATKAAEKKLIFRKYADLVKGLGASLQPSKGNRAIENPSHGDAS